MKPFIENELADITRITNLPEGHTSIKDIREILEMCYVSAYKEGNNDALKNIEKIAKNSRI